MSENKHTLAVEAAKRAYEDSVVKRPCYTGTHSPRAAWETLAKWEKATWVPEPMLKDFRFESESV